MIRRLHIRSCGDVSSYTPDSVFDSELVVSSIGPLADVDDDAGIGSPAIAPPETVEELLVKWLIQDGLRWMDNEINILFAGASDSFRVVYTS